MIAPLTELAMTDTMSKSHQRKEEEQMEPEEIIQDWVSIVIDETPTDDLRVGRDISPFPEIKIAFDGYAEGDDGDDESKLSFAVYIHKDADTEDFEFPGHESSSWGVEHRPSEEVCHFVWFDSNDEEFSGASLIESVDAAEVDYERILKVVETLGERYRIPEE